MEQVREVRCSALWLVIGRLVGFPGPVIVQGDRLSIQGNVLK